MAIPRHLLEQATDGVTAGRRGRANRERARKAEQAVEGANFFGVLGQGQHANQSLASGMGMGGVVAGGADGVGGGLSAGAGAMPMPSLAIATADGTMPAAGMTMDMGATLETNPGSVGAWGIGDAHSLASPGGFSVPPTPLPGPPPHSPISEKRTSIGEGQPGGVADSASAADAAPRSPLHPKLEPKFPYTPKTPTLPKSPRPKPPSEGASTASRKQQAHQQHRQLLQQSAIRAGLERPRSTRTPQLITSAIRAGLANPGEVWAGSPGFGVGDESEGHGLGYATGGKAPSPSSYMQSQESGREVQAEAGPAAEAETRPGTEGTPVAATATQVQEVPSIGPPGSIDTGTLQLSPGKKLTAKSAMMLRSFHHHKLGDKRNATLGHARQVSE